MKLANSEAMQGNWLGLAGAELGRSAAVARHSRCRGATRTNRTQRGTDTSQITAACVRGQVQRYGDALQIAPASIWALLRSAHATRAGPYTMSPCSCPVLLSQPDQAHSRWGNAPSHAARYRNLAR